MKEFTYVITDPEGIHARPAGALVKEAGTFSSKITISKDGKEVELWDLQQSKDRQLY